jgi:hypothetical protein
MTHSEFTPHAFITLSNCGGIEIMLNRSCDGVYYRFNYGQDNLESEEIFEAEIAYKLSEDEDEDTDTGFFHGEGEDTFYSLSQAMRAL